MASASAASEERPFEDTTIVDVDCHTSMVRNRTIAKDVSRHLEEPWKSHLDPDVDDSFSSAYPATSHPVSIPGKLYAERFAVTDPEEHINQASCETFGVDYAILNMVYRLDMLANSERIGQEMRGANNVMLDRFLDDHDHLYGLGCIGMRDPHDAAEEIDRIGSEEKFVGITIHPGGQERGLGDPRFDPIYEAAQDNDLPVTFHGSGSGNQWEMAGLVKGFNTYLQNHALAHPFLAMWTVTSIVTEGVPVKFPDLDFVYLEAGLGWVPYLMHRLNREYAGRRSEAPLLEESPEHYIREHFHFATQPMGEPDQPADIKQVIDLVGADSIMFSTDHPHFDFDNPESIRGFFSHLSEADQRAVFGENAIEVFDLPV
jgi:predicted TIM-barrel fold metal-dependent hydrolase